MRWNIHYEICALGLLLLLSLMVSGRRRLRTLRGNAYAVLVYVTLTATFVDLFTAFTLSYATKVPLWLNYSLNVLCLILAQSMPVVMLYYLLIVVKRPDVLKKRLALLSVPSLICSILIMTSPATGWIFFFDEFLKYQHGPYWIFMFTPSLFTMGLAVYYIVKSGGALPAKQRLALYSFDALLLCGTLLQAMLFEWTLITYLCCAISTLFIYITMENQDSFADPATQMPNSTAFLTIAGENALFGRKFAAAVFEIPEIEIVSAVHGSPLADKLRVRIAALISGQYGLQNSFAISGTRFCAIGKDIETLTTQAQITRAALNKGLLIEGRPFGISARTAVFSCPEHVDDPADITRFIDFLMNSSVNGMLIAGKAERNELLRRDGVRRALHKALDSEELQVYYQPMFDARTRRMIGAEALARVFGENSEIVPTEELIAAAELDGSIFRISSQLIKKVFRLISTLDTPERPDFISVNLNSVQLMQSGFADEIAKTAESSGVNIDRIAVEITETQQLQMSQQVSENIQALARGGVRLLLDDFGKGYSGVMRALTIPFSFLKLDKALVRELLRGGGEPLAQLTALMHTSGLKVVAEGIETTATADRLTECGCDLLQGYALGKPMPESEFKAMLRQNSGNISREAASRG